ncbi:MAG: insulinase family protein, partial [Dehalococcoidia bacterium]
FRLGLETPLALAQRAGEQLLTLGEIEAIETVVERLRAVGAEDVLRVAGRVLQPDKVALAVVGPAPDEGKLAELLTVTAQQK